MSNKTNRSVLKGFAPAVAGWFTRRFASPSPAQLQAWPAIQRGDSTLLLAPTGSGKTLAVFLCAIDRLHRLSQRQELPDAVQVLYVSPLKALGNDIHRNLLEPLEGIAKATRGRSQEIRVAVRTGDTSPSERARMLRHPPHILITTPESLYLLLQSQRASAMLRGVRTLIVDEIHALCSNKRGVHLSVSLERLVQLTGKPMQRLGCSATLKPLDAIAQFLVGFGGDGSPRPCTIVDAGMRKNLDVQVVAPLEDFLEASNTALWSSAYELLLQDIARHRTTLVFANSRYKAERTALHLAELAAPKTKIGAHHGSMARERRLEMEESLKRGKLDALVATSSLELGIDIGSVDVVYQLESPKTVSAGLQRIGRAGHLLGATSKGRVMVFERDELLEAAVICHAMTSGNVDAVRIPTRCLDVLAQQIAGAVAAGPWHADDLFTLIRRAYPYRNLSRELFDATLAMLAGEHSFQMAHSPPPLLLWDRTADGGVHGGKLSPTRACALVTAMCVGTIPESSDYEVVIASTNRRVGTVHSEFVDDSLHNGDVFVLGSSSWKVVGTRRNRLLVEPAPGSTPTVPWWLGPVESRTIEVGRGVGELRRQVASRLDDTDLPAYLQKTYHMTAPAAAAIIGYIREQSLTAGIVPDERHLLVESWRDELGRSNIIIHSPYGARTNNTWATAIAIRAKQRFAEDWSATASNDVILMTRRDPPVPPLKVASPQELLSLALKDELDETIAAAAQDAMGFGRAFRDAATCALQIWRAMGGKRVPPWLQAYRAGELFEAARNCSDYVVFREVTRAYVEDSLDLAGVASLLRWIAAGDVELIFRETRSPCPFGHAVLVTSRYDDHQMGRDRRAHLLRLHRQVLQEVLTTQQMAELLDQRAIEQVELKAAHRSEQTQARTADELAQALRDLGGIPAEIDAVGAIVAGGASEAMAMLQSLVREKRVVAHAADIGENPQIRLVPTDLWQLSCDAYRTHRTACSHHTLLIPQITHGQFATFKATDRARVIPARFRRRVTPAKARKTLIELLLRTHGPVTAYEIMNATGWPIGQVEHALNELVATDRVAKGIYTATKPTPQWVDKANLEEIHRLTLGYLKRELSACTPAEVVDFMTRWQHVHPSTQLTGLDGLRTAIAQIQGCEIVQGFLETEVLPSRVRDYSSAMLDTLIRSGEVCWRRLSLRWIRRGAMTLCFRRDMRWLAAAPSNFDCAASADADIRDEILAVRRYFADNGPAFFDDVLSATGLPEDVATRAVWYLAWAGDLTCDSFECVRHAHFEATLSGCYDLMHRPDQIPSGKDTMARVIARMRSRKLDPRLGRWSPTERLVPPRQPLPESDVAREWAAQLLKRWGIVTRDILAGEIAAPAWDLLLRELKRLELLGKVTRGYFIESHHGEQYGLPEAIELLRDCRARRNGSCSVIPDEPAFPLSLQDPANLYASCLQINDEAGRQHRMSNKQAMSTSRMVIQAGQAVLFPDGTQLVRMTGRQLHRAILALCHRGDGAPMDVELHAWNGQPIELHPIAPLLKVVGFAQKATAWIYPPADGAKRDKTIPDPDRVFPPAGEDTIALTDSVFVERAPELIRPVLSRLVHVLRKELPGPDWEMTLRPRGFRITYRGVCCMQSWMSARRVLATLRPHSKTGFDKVLGRRQWFSFRTPEDINPTYIADLRERRLAAERCIADYLARHG